MAQRTDIFDLGRLGLSSGEGRRLELRVAVDALEYGGEPYAPRESSVDVVLDVSHTTTGYALRLRYGVSLAGACVRCLEDAGLEVAVDAREIDQPGGGDELRSPYVEGDNLDLRSWTRDALALALPLQVVCDEGCLGLCPVCGENLNEASPDHAHAREPDARWAKLGELRFE